MTPGKDTVEEYDFAEYREREGRRMLENGETALRCDVCGAEFFQPAEGTATVCPMCGSPQIKPEEEHNGIPVEGVVPFAIDRYEAQKRFGQWIRKRWFAPASLKRTFAEGELVGMYVPFWTYDADAVTQYCGRGGRTYTRRGRDGKTETYTQWYPVSGVVRGYYNDIQVCASKTASGNLIQKVLPYNTIGNTNPYHPQYLAGYQAECYTIDGIQGFKVAESYIDRDQRSRAESDIRGHGYSQAQVTGMNTHYDTVRYKQVLVPFGSGGRKLCGYVIELTDQAEYDVRKIKEITEICKDSVAIESQLIALAFWMKKNYGGTMNQALKTVIPIKQKTAAKEKRILVLAADEKTAEEQLAEFRRKHNVARARLLEALIRERELSGDVVKEELNVGLNVVRAMEKLGILKIRTEQDYRNPVRQREREERKFLLSESQQAAVDAVLRDRREQRQGIYLLHGVTGSGKTEVYMELIAHNIAEGKQAIVLIPEIALTYQTVRRFYDRFGNRVSILNSRLSAGERYDQFLRAKRGEIDIMIGPRSALFTPFSNLGLIIIDEEHESSYKSETVPRYHARETAIERAGMTGASVILGSATPSIESYTKAQNGEYHLLEMKERISKRPLPTCYTVDLREELKTGNRSILSRKLQELMEERLAKQEQIMLFLNRRGMSGFVSCRSCGHVIKCPHCDVSLSWHSNGKMICHYCGYEEPEAHVCPECGSRYISGFKAGTQKIEMLVKKRFPKARVLRMDFDTTRKKESYEKILSAFANHEADILVGTQMIVKGHDFPNVTLVGVLAADLSLGVSDYRASERTFQLLTQAAGRAGRGDRPGEVVIQTYQPEHYSIVAAAAQDYASFYAHEMEYRRMLCYPPVWNMLLILSAAKNEELAYQASERMKRVIAALGYQNLFVVGPADTAVAKVNDIYKKVLYLKHADYAVLVDVKDRLEHFINGNRELKNIVVQFDFNPMNGF